MRLLFFIDSFDGGGAARLISQIANGLSTRGNSVLIASNFNRDIAYPLNVAISKLDWYPLDYYEKRRFVRVCCVIRNARRIINDVKPDVVISSVPHVVFISKLAALGLKVPFVFADVTSYARKDSAFVHFIRYHFYKIADRVTIQTQNDYIILGDRLPQKVVINNPLSFEIIDNYDSRRKSVLVIGHTDRWNIKGFDIMFRVWKNISAQFPDWNLEIIGGESPKSREYLDKMIHELGIEDSVSFLGFRKDTDAIMRQVSIFALPSRIEGFSISLIEAMSQGLPSVAFKIHDVITDVSDNGHGTILVDDGDISGFEKGLVKLIEDENLRSDLSKDARAFVKRYSVPSIIDKWEYLLNELNETYDK